MGFEELMGIDEIMGFEEIGDEELGARVRRAATRRKLPSPPAATTAPAGMAGLRRKRTVVGLPKATFANNDPAGTTKTIEVEPQRDFQPNRLVVAAVSPVPSAKVGIRQVTIGDVPQFPSQQPAPIEGFRHDAQNCEVDWTLAKAGVKVTIQYEILTTLGAAEGGDVQAELFGDTVAQ